MTPQKETREPEETYTANYHEVLCPYCGKKNDLSESIGMRGEDVTTWDCGDCGKEFKVRVHISISVTAERK